MTVLVLVTRILLGSIFLAYGLDGFLHFMPPHQASIRASAFVSALIDSGFIWQLMKGTQVLAGVLLLTDWYVPLALVLLAPIITIIFCMQLFLDPAGLPVGSSIAILELALAWFYRDYFKSVLVRRAASAQTATGAENRTQLSS